MDGLKRARMEGGKMEEKDGDEADLNSSFGWKQFGQHEGIVWRFVLFAFVSF